jgi:hypothetical protein
MENPLSIDDTAKETPYINVIFERSSPTRYSKNAMLYQNIIEYALEDRPQEGFRFNELAKWLMI